MERDDLTPPVRHSMTDDELEVLIQQAHSDSSGTLQAMEVLAQQAQLRQQDDLAFAQWVSKLESIGSEEALQAITKAKAELGIAVKEAEPQPAPTVDNQPQTETFTNSQQEQQEEVEYRPVSTLGVAKVEIPEAEIAEPESLEHDLVPADINKPVEDVIDVQLDLHTGVAVTDFDALLHSHIENEEIDFEPEDIDTASVKTVTQPRRSGAHPFSQFWVWFGLASGVLPIYLGSALKTIGLTGLQAFIALLAGVLASAVVVAVGAVAGKRSGMPTIFLARSTFGVFGNVIPAAILLLARLALTVLIALAALQLLGSKTFGFDFGQSLLGSNSPSWLNAGNLVLLLLVSVAAVIATLSSRIALWLQITVGSLGLVTVLVALTQSQGNFADLFVNTNGSWWLTIGAALLIFAGFGGLWSHASADFTQSLGASASGFKVFSFAALGALVPVLSGSLGIIWAQTEVSKQSWFSGLFFGSLALTLLVWMMMSLVSTGFALHSIGLKLAFAWLLPIVGVLTVVGGAWAHSSGATLESWVGGYLPLAGVPLLAWTGLFVSEILIRRIAYHEVSLQRSYGIYRGINWVTVSGFLVATALGWGYVTSSADGASWLGYLIQFSGSSPFWFEAQIGLAMSFLVGALVPVAFGISRIKRQEAEVLAIESRRLDLNDVAIES